MALCLAQPPGLSYLWPAQVADVSHVPPAERQRVNAEAVAGVSVVRFFGSEGCSFPSFSLVHQDTIKLVLCENDLQQSTVPKAGPNVKPFRRALEEIKEVLAYRATAIASATADDIAWAGRDGGGPPLDLADVRTWPDDMRAYALLQRPSPATARDCELAAPSKLLAWLRTTAVHPDERAVQYAEEGTADGAGQEGVGPSGQRLLHSRAVAMAAAAGVTAERLQVLRLQAIASATGPAAATAAVPAAAAAAEEGQPAAAAAARAEAAAREPVQPRAAKPPAKKAKHSKVEKPSSAGVGSSDDSEEDRPIKRARVSDGAAKGSTKAKKKEGQERVSKQQAAASGGDGGAHVDRGVGKGEREAAAVAETAAVGAAEAARRATKSEEGAAAAGPSAVNAAARQHGGGTGPGGSSEGMGGEDSDVMIVDGEDAATRGKAKQGEQQKQSVPQQRKKLRASAESDSRSDQDGDQREYASLSPAYDGDEGTLDRDRSTTPGRKERAQREGDEAGTAAKTAPMGKGPGASSGERQQQLQQARREGRLPAPAWKATAAAVRHLGNADRPPYCGEKLPAPVVRLSVCMLRQLARDPRSATSLTTTRNSIVQRAALLRVRELCYRNSSLSSRGQVGARLVNVLKVAGAWNLPPGAADPCEGKGAGEDRETSGLQRAASGGLGRRGSVNTPQAQGPLGRAGSLTGKEAKGEGREKEKEKEKGSAGKGKGGKAGGTTLADDEMEFSGMDYPLKPIIDVSARPAGALAGGAARSQKPGSTSKLPVAKAGPSKPGSGSGLGTGPGGLGVKQLVDLQSALPPGSRGARPPQRPGSGSGPGHGPAVPAGPPMAGRLPQRTPGNRLHLWFGKGVPVPTESTMEAAVDVAVAEKLDPSRRPTVTMDYTPARRCATLVCANDSDALRLEAWFRIRGSELLKLASMQNVKMTTTPEGMDPVSPWPASLTARPHASVVLPPAPAPVPLPRPAGPKPVQVPPPPPPRAGLPIHAQPDPRSRHLPPPPPPFSIHLPPQLGDGFTSPESPRGPPAGLYSPTGAGTSGLYSPTAAGPSGRYSPTAAEAQRYGPSTGGPMGQFNNPIDPRGGPWGSDPWAAGHVLHGGVAQLPPVQGPVGAVTDPRLEAREAAAGAALPEDPRRRDESGGGDTRPADPRGSLPPPLPGVGAGGAEARPRFGSGVRGLRERERERGRDKDRDGPGGRGEGDRRDKGDGGEGSMSPEQLPVEGGRDAEGDRERDRGVSSHWPQPGIPPLQPQYPVAGVPHDPRSAGQVQASGMAYQPAAGQPVGAMGGLVPDPRLAAAAGASGQAGAAAPPAGVPAAEVGGMQGPGAAGALPGGGHIEQVFDNLAPEARFNLIKALEELRPGLGNGGDAGGGTGGA